VEPSYLQAIGQFVWNFALLEWDVVYIVVKLNNDEWTKTRLNSTSGDISKALARSIEEQAARLPTAYVIRLRAFAKHYEADILERNGLLHVHPYTASDGAQQLGGEDRKKVLREWTLERLREHAELFKVHQREGNALLHEYVREFAPKVGGVA